MLARWRCDLHAFSDTALARPRRVTAKTLHATPVRHHVGNRTAEKRRCRTSAVVYKLVHARNSASATASAPVKLTSARGFNPRHLSYNKGLALYEKGVLAGEVTASPAYPIAFEPHFLPALRHMDFDVIDLDQTGGT